MYSDPALPFITEFLILYSVCIRYCNSGNFMIPFFGHLSKFLPGRSLMPAKPGLLPPGIALGMVCVLLANCTQLPQAPPIIVEEVAQQTDAEKETNIKKETESITEPEPAAISHALEEEETIVIIDDGSATEWQADSPSMREKSERQILLAKTQLDSGFPTTAVETLLKLDSEVTGEARLETWETLLQILESLDSLHRLLLLEEITDPNLAGWLALLEVLVSGTQAELQNWRRVWPNHPASSAFIDSYIVNRPQNRQQIALLLPLASPDGRAARAFYDGFSETHRQDSSWPKPDLVLYDIGSDPSLAPFYYRGAETGGADFIVGPLGRKAVGSLLASGNLETDTLLLADIPSDKVTDNLYGISLSPENEARQMANKAYASGHRNASVLRSEGEWGERVANAFVNHWEGLGGQLVKNASFPKDVSHHTKVVQKFLGVDKSIVRHRLMEAQTGLDLKFTPRRNEDMDFIFLAATAAQSRLIVPQLRFFQGHGVPLYATSYVYAGKPDPAMNADLDGLIFGEMRWVLDGVALYKQQKAMAKVRRAAESGGNPNDREENPPPGTDAPADTPEALSDTGVYASAGAPEALSDSGVTAPDSSGGHDKSDDFNAGMAIDTDAGPQRPYARTALDRLYALGVQSYQIIPRLPVLRQNPWMKFPGKAMTVRVGADGNVVHLPVWARFELGLAEPLPETGSPDSSLYPVRPGEEM